MKRQAGGNGRLWWIETVASMEQIIGAAMSAIVGIVIPLLNLLSERQVSPLMQGFMGASGLIGIAAGSAVIGTLSNRSGYLKWFRTSAWLMAAGSALTLISSSPHIIICGLFVCGLGVGGGYSLDSAYISELMPQGKKGLMVGAAKASSGIGFLVPVVAAVVILELCPHPQSWRYVVATMLLLSLITVAMRVHWAESPMWLLQRGKTKEALAAMRFFFGKDAVLPSLPVKTVGEKEKPGLLQMLRGKNLRRVVYTGIPWACEGVGVYGIGVFVPILIALLGIASGDVTDIAGIIGSMKTTTIVNACILPGFVIGLLLVDKIGHFTLLWTGLAGSALGLALLFAAYMCQWPVWVMVVAFALFELTLNAGPHLVTYILPTEVFPPSQRAIGTGIAGFTGKLGAIVGVFLIPLLLHWGGIPLVLVFSIAVMLLGALVAWLSRC